MRNKYFKIKKAFVFPTKKYKQTNNKKISSLAYVYQKTTKQDKKNAIKCNFRMSDWCLLEIYHQV